MIITPSTTIVSLAKQLYHDAMSIDIIAKGIGYTVILVLTWAVCRIHDFLAQHRYDKELRRRQAAGGIIVRPYPPRLWLGRNYYDLD